MASFPGQADRSGGTSRPEDGGWRMEAHAICFIPTIHHHSMICLRLGKREGFSSPDLLPIGSCAIEWHAATFTVSAMCRDRGCQLGKIFTPPEIEWSVSHPRRAVGFGRETAYFMHLFPPSVCNQTVSVSVTARSSTPVLRIHCFRHLCIYMVHRSGLILLGKLSQSSLPGGEPRQSCFEARHVAGQNVRACS